MTAVSDRLAKAAEALLSDKYLADPINNDRMSELRAAHAAYQTERAALAMPPVVGMPVIVPDDADRGVLYTALHWHVIKLEASLKQALKQGQGQSAAYAEIDQQRERADGLRAGLMGGVYQARLAAATAEASTPASEVAEALRIVLANSTYAGMGDDELREVMERGSEFAGLVLTGRAALARFGAEYGTNPDARKPESEAPKPAFVVVQEGGSSDELYIHASDSEDDALEFRASCADGAYRTSGVIEVPAALASHGEGLYELLEAVAVASKDLDTYEPEEGMAP